MDTRNPVSRLGFFVGC